MRKLLLISNSTNPGEPYLGWPKSYIQDFLSRMGVSSVLFIPYAGVNLAEKDVQTSFDNYESKVRDVFKELGVALYSIHRYPDPKAAVKNAEAIVVGGGNTFHLVYMLYRMELVETIQQRVKQGLPFIGWSAGANIACPTMKTTNDMPIIEPESFNTLNLVPFQINPHYLDKNPEGHGGETRLQRLEEFLFINRNIFVVGLREGTLLEINKDEIQLKGNRPAVVLKYGQAPAEFAPFEDIRFLLMQ